jgi:hypothetical protein
LRPGPACRDRRGARGLRGARGGRGAHAAPAAGRGAGGGARRRAGVRRAHRGRRGGAGRGTGSGAPVGAAAAAAAAAAQATAAVDKGAGPPPPKRRMRQAAAAPPPPGTGISVLSDWHPGSSAVSGMDLKEDSTLCAAPPRRLPGGGLGTAGSPAAGVAGGAGSATAQGSQVIGNCSPVRHQHQQCLKGTTGIVAQSLSSPLSLAWITRKTVLDRTRNRTGAVAQRGGYAAAARVGVERLWSRDDRGHLAERGSLRADLIENFSVRACA